MILRPAPLCKSDKSRSRSAVSEHSGHSAFPVMSSWADLALPRSVRKTQDEEQEGNPAGGNKQKGPRDGQSVTQLGSQIHQICSHFSFSESLLRRRKMEAESLASF